MSAFDGLWISAVLAVALGAIFTHMPTAEKVLAFFFYTPDILPRNLRDFKGADISGAIWKNLRKARLIYLLIVAIVLFWLLPDRLAVGFHWESAIFHVSGDYLNGGERYNGNTHLITEEELNTYTRKSLRYLMLRRNEIYAVHGFRFQDKTVRDYFNRKTWYRPAENMKGVKPEDIIESSYGFGKTEIQNIERIKRYEEKLKAVS